MFLKRCLYLCLTVMVRVSDMTERRQVRKLNATPEICRRMIPPGFQGGTKNTKMFFDYSVIAQLVLKRSVNFSFIGTRHKRISALMAQVRINGTPAGRFEGYGSEFYIDCPPGTMNTFYYAAPETVAGRRIMWHAPKHAGRPIIVYTTFVDRTGLLWKNKEFLRNMIVLVEESCEGGEDMSAELFSEVDSPGSMSLEDLVKKKIEDLNEVNIGDAKDGNLTI